jgi:hypothetical protein
MHGARLTAERAIVLRTQDVGDCGHGGAQCQYRYRTGVGFDGAPPVRRNALARLDFSSVVNYCDHDWP